MSLSGPSSRAIWAATATAPPEEPPANTPSSRVRRRAYVKHSRSSTWRTWSTTLKSIASHTRSSPMPSTLYTCGVPNFPVSNIPL
jgi:hypothetical protein